MQSNQRSTISQTASHRFDQLLRPQENLLRRTEKEAPAGRVSRASDERTNQRKAQG